MRAIVCEQLGDPTWPLGSGVLRLSENTPAPDIKPGQQQQYAVLNVYSLWTWDASTCPLQEHTRSIL
jgi:hypothetical protein